MVRLCAVAVGALVASTDASKLRLKSMSQLRIDAMADELALKTDSDFWPFTSWSTPEKKIAAPVVEAPRKRVQDAQQILLASSVFQQKTADLCKTASSDIMQDCENAASERLFCSMFTRHVEKFAGMDGETEQKEKCRGVDIMETAVDAAKDKHEQDMMAEDK